MAKFITLAILALMMALSFAEISDGPIQAMIRGNNTTLDGTTITPCTTPTATVSIAGVLNSNPPFSNTSTSHLHSITKTITGPDHGSITKITTTGPLDSTSTITHAPTIMKTILEKKAPAANGCHLTTLYGGQAGIVVEVCDPYTTICRECVGCNAPVVVCSTY